MRMQAKVVLAKMHSKMAIWYFTAVHGSPPPRICPVIMPVRKHATIMTVRQSVPSDIDALTLRYRKIKVPTLILWGDDDKIVPLISGKRLHEDLPNSEIVVFESCGHIPQEEMPLATQSAIEGFLSRH